MVMWMKRLGIACGLFVWSGLVVANGGVRHIQDFRAPQSPCAPGRGCLGSQIVANKKDLYYALGTGVVGLHLSSGKLFSIFYQQKGLNSVLTRFIDSNLLMIGSLLFFVKSAPPAHGWIYAVDVKTGRLVWSKQYTGDQIWTDEHRLYLGRTYSDGLEALNPETGHLLWRAMGNTSDWVSRLVVSHGRVYTNTEIRVLDALTGRTVLRLYKATPYSGRTNPNGSAFMPLISGKRLSANDSSVFMATKGILYAYHATTSQPRWQIDLSSLLAGAHIIELLANSRFVYVLGKARGSHGFRPGELVALDASNGRLEWRDSIRTSRASQGPAARLFENRLFLLQSVSGQPGSELVALNAATGKPIWRFRSALELLGPPTPAGRYIVVPNCLSDLVALQAASGRLVWIYRPAHDLPYYKRFNLCP